MDELDPVFKALADPGRRLLLDRLQERNGQSLLELQGYLPMSRFGVMKHLKVLEEAGLVVSRKAGREKFHYLNTVPLQRVYDRWVSTYAQPWASALTGLKVALEDPRMIATHAQLFEIYIRATPERVWQALTDGALTPHYYFGTRVDGDWSPGGSYRYLLPGGGTMLAGEVLEADPPRRLVTTFEARWSPEAAALPASRVTWEIEPVGETSKLTVIHDDLDLDNPVGKGIRTGWAQILSGLKTLLETGEPLPIAAATVV